MVDITHRLTDEKLEEMESGLLTEDVYESVDPT